MTWDWAYAWECVPPLLDAFRMTLLATVLVTAVASTLGLVLALVERSTSFVARLVGMAAEFIRRTPGLIQIYFVFYVGPTVGLTLSPLTCGVIAMGVHFATYMSESYRAGIAAVARGQWDAAVALNFPPLQTWTKVIMPQAIPPILAAQGNWVLILFKGTAVLSVITVVEITSKAAQIGSDNLRFLEPTLLVGVIFLTVSYPASVLLRAYERRISKHTYR